MTKITSKWRVNINPSRLASGGLADQLGDRDVFPYEDIPNFPVSTVKGHAGRMVIGLLSGVPVMCMQGRFHAYEGYPLWKVSRLAKVYLALFIYPVVCIFSIMYALTIECFPAIILAIEYLFVTSFWRTVRHAGARDEADGSGAGHHHQRRRRTQPGVQSRGHHDHQGPH